MKLTSKGQVTIPRKLRDQYGLNPDTEVTFEATRDGVLLKPARADRRKRIERGLRRARGSATAMQSTEDIMRLTRGED